MIGTTRPSRNMFPHRVDLILVSTEDTAATGGLAPGEAVIATGLAALVADRKGRRGQVGTRDEEVKWVRVCFPDLVRLGEGWIVRVPDGTAAGRRLRVDSFRDDLNLGRLWVAECEEMPVPPGRI